MSLFFFYPRMLYRDGAGLSFGMDISTLTCGV